MKDPQIKKGIVKAIRTISDPVVLVKTIDNIVGGITKVKTKGDGKISIYNHNDAYPIRVGDDDVVKAIVLAAFAQGYEVEAHLGEGLSTKHYAKAFREASEQYI